MNKQEAADTIYHCLRLLDSIEALLERAKVSLMEVDPQDGDEDTQEFEVVFTPWTDAEVVNLDEYRRQEDDDE